MEPNDFVILHLLEPKELFWGRLIRLDTAGVVIRGIDLKQVDSFKYELKATSRSIFPQTVFYPMRRIMQIARDEWVDDIPSIVDGMLQYEEISRNELLREDEAHFA